MPKIVELRQERNLVQPNFDGYKLSLDPVPIIRQELHSSPYKAEPNDDQYSLLHAELFSMQNLLQTDPWLRTSAYFVNRLGEVVRCNYNESVGRPDETKVVYRLAESAAPRSKGDYNYSLRFVSEKYCVLSDGKRGLFLFDTGDRLKGPEWKLAEETQIAVDGAEGNFVLYDARLDTINEVKQISLALGHVERVVESHTVSTTYYLHVHWAKWTLRDTWQFDILDTLEGRGSLYYCAFEPRAESLVMCSNRDFRFRSAKSKEVTPVESDEKEKVQLHDETSAIGGFSWTQTDEDISIKFDTQEGREKSDYSIRGTMDTLEVKCADTKLLDKALFSKIDPDLTTWTIENNFLQVILVKHTPSLYWPSLLADGAGPKESLDNGKQNCLPMEQQPIPNLEAPIEDCDFPMGTDEDEVKIERFHLSSKTITHSVFLGPNPPLFHTNLRPGFPAAVVTRQDVDASLWLQQYNPSKPDEWSLRHEGNLHAFGYVQASKQQKKFMDCAPDMSYALICESFRHLFLYRSTYDGADGLRNRSGPQVKLGKQHLITLEDDGEVLGVTAASNVAILLTNNNVLYLQVN